MKRQLSLLIPILMLAAAAADAQTQLARQRFAITGDQAAAAGHRGLVADGQGNASGASAAGLRTSSGGQGLRSRSFNRSSDGSLTAQGQASASGDKGSAQRSGDFARSADGSASGQRSSSVTSAETGNTREARAGYVNGEGITRSVSCKDSSGQAIDCPKR